MPAWGVCDSRVCLPAQTIHLDTLADNDLLRREVREIERSGGCPNSPTASLVFNGPNGYAATIKFPLWEVGKPCKRAFVSAQRSFWSWFRRRSAKTGRSLLQ